MIHTEIVLPVELITHPDLKPQALRLIAYILSRTEESDRSFDLKTSEWARDLNCAASTIRRWIGKLVELGVVVAKGIAGRVKQYLLNGLPRCPPPLKLRRDADPCLSKERDIDLTAFNESLSEPQKREIVLRVWEQVVSETGLNEATQHNIQRADKLYREELRIMRKERQESELFAKAAHKEMVSETSASAGGPPGMESISGPRKESSSRRLSSEQKFSAV